MKDYTGAYCLGADQGLETDLIQAAIDACHFSGGGEVTVSAGVHRIGVLWLRSNVTLHLLPGAVLCGSTEPEDYAYIPQDLENLQLPYQPGMQIADTDPYSRWNRALIKAICAENIAVIGDEGSVIDGVNCYDPQGEEQYRGPHGINFHGCRNITLSGYTVKDTGNWAHALFGCENIKVQNVQVLGGHDGIDLFICRNVVIADCNIHTGDDCIAGYGSKTVSVSGCNFSTACSVFRFGGTDVKVSSCIQTVPAKYGHRYMLTAEEKANRAPTTPACRTNTLTAFLYYCDERFIPLDVPGNICIEDSVFHGVDAFFHINFGNHIWSCGRSLASITFRNCRFYGLCESAYIYSDKELPFSLELVDTELHAKSNAPETPFIEGAQFHQITLDHVRLFGYREPTFCTCCTGTIDCNDTDPFLVVEKEYVINLNSK